MSIGFLIALKHNTKTMRDTINFWYEHWDGNKSFDIELDESEEFNVLINKLDIKDVKKLYDFIGGYLRKNGI